MSNPAHKLQRLESLLARLLNYGTWLASAVIAFGLISSNKRFVIAGIGLFILLPFFRVVLMLIVFARQRDYRFVLIAATVLLIIVAGMAVGAVER